MKFVDEYQSPALVRKLLAAIRSRAAALDRRISIMEVCGSHTMAIARFGLKQLLPENIRLVSGPGCPVCVTAAGEIDRALWLARQPGVLLTTFGDLLRVPGSDGESLESARARGAEVVTVHSALEALRLAAANPDRQVVSIAIGFETTSPTVAAAVLQAAKMELKNFFVFSCHKLMPPVMRQLLDDEQVGLDAFLCPGHVATIIGAEAFSFISQANKTAVVAGFEPVDILQAILAILADLSVPSGQVGIAYRRAVTAGGNRKARELLARVFKPVDAVWRGLGEIPGSGLGLREEFRQFAAAAVFDLPPVEGRGPAGCRCGDVLRGIIEPADCALFGRPCKPTAPVGPCMVSNEGSCAAAYRFPASVAGKSL